MLISAAVSDGRVTGPNLVAVTPRENEVERWSRAKVWLFSLFNRDPRSNRATVERLSPGPGDRVLDLGCGLGAALEHVRATGAAAAGIDPSPSMVEKASARVPDAEIAVGSAEEIPFPDARFTAALAVSTYHHWANPEAGLAEAHRVLAPGGQLLIVEGRLKRSKGHGLHSDGAGRLAETLLEIGFSDASVSEMRVGRHDYLAISAIKP